MAALPREYRYYLLISVVMSWAVIAPLCGVFYPSVTTGRHRYSFDPDGAEGGHCPMQVLARLVMKGSEQFQQKPHLLCGVKNKPSILSFPEWGSKTTNGIG